MEGPPGMLVVALLTTCNDSCPSPNAARFRHLANLRRGGCGEAGQRLGGGGVSLLLAGVSILGLVALAIGYSFYSHHQRESARLEAVADLRSSQIQAWVQERFAQARFLGSSQFFATLLRVTGANRQTHRAGRP